MKGQKSIPEKEYQAATIPNYRSYLLVLMQVKETALWNIYRKPVKFQYRHKSPGDMILYQTGRKVIYSNGGEDAGFWYGFCLLLSPFPSFFSFLFPLIPFFLPSPSFLFSLIENRFFHTLYSYYIFLSPNSSQVLLPASHPDTHHFCLLLENKQSSKNNTKRR